MCTWKDCGQPAAHDEVGKDGSVWARLCIGHHEELEAALDSLDVKAIMRAYIKAQGGANAAAARMLGGK